MADKRKPLTPYQRLMDEARKFAFSVKFPRTVGMFYYPKAKLSEGWSMTDLWERTKAAEQLGYDVVLYAKDDGLHVKYVKKRPATPMGWE